MEETSKPEPILYASRAARLPPGKLPINVPLRTDLTGRAAHPDQNGVADEDLFSDADLLRVLWKNAAIEPGQLQNRGWLYCARRLIKSGERFIVDKKGKTLKRFLLAGAPNDPDPVARHNDGVRASTRHDSHHLFVVGRLNNRCDVPQGLLGPMLALQENQALPAIYLRPKVLIDLLNSQPEIKSAYVGGADIVVLCRISRFKGNNYLCINIAGLPPV